VRGFYDVRAQSPVDWLYQGDTALRRAAALSAALALAGA